MPRCKYDYLCGRDGGEGTEEDLCILHSKSSGKNKQAFDEALDTHRQIKGDDFSFFVFPEDIDFTFHSTTFHGKVNFFGATFLGQANFDGVTFDGEARFDWASFNRMAFFTGAFFNEEATFNGATFHEEVSFNGAMFRGVATFRYAEFLGRALFIGRERVGRGGSTFPIFFGTTVDFREVVIEPLDALVLRDADLQYCLFLDTDLRKAEITGAVWPKIGGRFCVADEKNLEKGEFWPWSRLERLYRELKQNHEDRRDYERASDFHYGEKEMRRKNLDTPLSLRFFLTLYWVVSGYGERYRRPLVWAAILLVVSTIAYLWIGLEGKWPGGRTSILSMSSVGDWLQAAHYSFRAMTFLKPEDVATPMGYARAVHTAQSLLGPLFLGLFALAIRQRLKR